MSKRVVVHAEIRNKLGLHARPAMSFVDTASQFQCAVTVIRCAAGGSAGEAGAGAAEAGGGVDGKSIMQMTMLAATKGTVLEIRAEGDDAEKAAESLKNLIDSGFDED